MCVCVCVFLTSLLRHSGRESGVKRKNGSHSVGIHGSAPVGQSGLHCSQTKPLQRDPDTLTQKRGTQERGRQGDKGRESGEGVRVGQYEKVYVAPIRPKIQVQSANVLISHQTHSD